MCDEMDIYNPTFNQYDAETLPEAIEVFLENGGDVNGLYDHESSWKETPLYYAISANSAPAVQLLLDAGADPSRTGNSRIRPLHIACASIKTDTLEIVTLLLDYVDNITAQDKNGRTAVHYAFRARNSSLVNMLLARLPKGANPSDKSNLSILHIACAQGADQVVRDLLDCGAPINSYTKGELYRSSSQLTPIKFAILNNRRSTVELLLERGAEAFGGMLLHLACEINSEKFIADLDGQLVEMREDMDVSERDHLGIINLLLNHGLDVNITDEYGLTPLLHFCAGKITCTETWRASLIFSETANSNVLEQRHVTVRRRLIAQCLLERGAAINARCPDGRNLLHFEFDCNFLGPANYDDEIMKLFVKYGVDVNAKDKRQFTPLHATFDQVMYSESIFFAHRDDWKVALLLLHGADVNARSAAGLTPVAFFLKQFCGSEDQLRKCTRLKLMLLHAQRLIMIGQNVDGEIKELIKRLNLAEMPKAKKQWADELERMKRDYIDDTTLYRMLRTGLDGADQCVNENKLEEIMENMRVKEKYPNFQYLIKLMVRRGPLVKSAEPVLKAMAHCELPSLCAQNIIKHLTDSDLRNLAEIPKLKNMPSESEHLEPPKKKQRR